MNEIIEGDCLEVLGTLEPKSVDLVLTDPPYFLPVNSYVGVRGEGYHKRTLADTSILKGYFAQVFEKLDRILKDTGTFYVFCDLQYLAQKTYSRKRSFEFISQLRVDL